MRAKLRRLAVHISYLLDGIKDNAGLVLLTTLLFAVAVAAILAVLVAIKGLLWVLML